MHDISKEKEVFAYLAVTVPLRGNSKKKKKKLTEQDSDD
jgi:hypothetical protein